MHSLISYQGDLSLSVLFPTSGSCRENGDHLLAPSFLVPGNLLSMNSTSAFRSLIKMLIIDSPSTQSWGTKITVHMSVVIPFTAAHWDLLLSKLITQNSVIEGSPMRDCRRGHTKAKMQSQKKNKLTEAGHSLHEPRLTMLDYSSVL